MIKYKKTILTLIDSISFILALFVSSFFLGISLHNYHDTYLLILIFTLPKLLLSHLVLYNKIIRYAGIKFIFRLTQVLILSEIISFLILTLTQAQLDIKFYILDFLISYYLVSISRFTIRIYFERKRNLINPKRVLIYGAGAIGASIIKVLSQNRTLNYKIVGFIDDNPSKTNREIEGIPVLGTSSNIKEIVESLNIQEIIIAFNHPPRKLLTDIYETCRKLRIKCRVIPGITSYLSQNLSPRDIQISDFISRPERSLNKDEIQSLLNDQRVLITGAAGSIGSEILNQVLKYNPQEVMILDHSELGIYNLQEKLAHHELNSKCTFSLTDIKLNKIIRKEILDFKPDITFHAAAYKHVPILEDQIEQALENNVVGLKNVLDACQDAGTHKFIFISTDKAVNPTNIMGSTKRIGELIIEEFDGSMECSAVRFGNVLASSGSVIPKFIEQIKNGGPVTVTHPDMTRYFMLIPEAVELVLQASVLGKNGDVMVLDMGEPVKINDLAENLIYSMGLIPKEDIEIIYTGLREGEKMHEELFYNDANRIEGYKDIYRAKDIDICQETKNNINLMLNYLKENKTDKDLVEFIKKIVPEYHSEF